MTDIESQIPSAACIIIQYLEKISQEHYSASWICDIEHSVWEHLLNPPPIEDELFFRFPEAEITQLRKLAAECNGWVRFDDTAKDFFNSRVFVPMDEWVKLHAAYIGKEMTDDQRKRFEHFMVGPEQALKNLKEKQRKLQDHVAAVVLAIQASGRVEAHHDFLEVLKMIPAELRSCPECGTNPNEAHHLNCKSSNDKIPSETVYDNAFVEKLPWP